MHWSCAVRSSQHGCGATVIKWGSSGMLDLVLKGAACWDSVTLSSQHSGLAAIQRHSRRMLGLLVGVLVQGPAEQRGDPAH